MSLLGAMCSGADSIDDADLLRHGAMDRAFTGIRAPSTLGTFLRSFTHGHNRPGQELPVCPVEVDRAQSTDCRHM